MNAVRNNRYVFSDHADNMLRERAIVHWQIVEGFENSKLLSVRQLTLPNPTIEVEQLLPNGVPIKVIWAYVRQLDIAKVVTLHFFDR